MIVKMILMMSVAVFGGGVLFFLFSIWRQVYGGAPFVVTTPAALEAMMELAEIRPGEVVYDLGCGDGRLLLEANRSYGATAVGIELSRVLCRLARWRCGTGATILHGDIMTCDFQDADIVFCYLMPSLMEKLKPRFDLLKKGSRIVSQRFEIPGWEPELHVPRVPHAGIPPLWKYRV